MILKLNTRLIDYDFTYQPFVNKSQLNDLATSIGIETASKRQLTYFISCHDLIQNLKKAYEENRLEARLKHYNKYKVLIIDEIEYLPAD